MSPDRWQKISEVFLAAAEQSAEARAGFLSRACGSDMALREEVESLLAQDARETSFLRETADAALRVSQLAAPPEIGRADAGMRVGSYQLVRQVASGGMGSVWLADRADEQFRGRAAVKLIKRGMDTDDILHRFRQERQVLANLRHPNICRLLDGGAAPDGRPYLVMDYVEGVAIDAYCNDKRLTIRQRLELFRRVCEAVQFAHQNLVVHRDLKPSNILVSQDGTPILLDFGIAKVIQPEGTSATAEMTAPQQRLMTPQYASPEQVKGQPITTATDVYSLGVILYELLTGRHPYRHTGASLRDIEQAICDHEPEKPSVAVTKSESLPTAPPQTPGTIGALRGMDLKRVSRTLSGDIDTIVLKALQKEPSRRYVSVEQLNNDIARHLAGLPVIARPDTISYRAVKFVRRNLLVLSVTAGVIIVVAMAAISLALMASRLGQERNEAIAARAQAEAESLRTEAEARKYARTLEFLQGILTSVDPKTKNPEKVTVLEVLDRALETLDRDHDEQPLVKGAVLLAIGRAYDSLGIAVKAESALRAASNLLNNAAGVEATETQVVNCQLGEVLINLGKLDEAEALIANAVQVLRTKGAEQATNLGFALSNLSNVQFRLGNYRGAESSATESLELFKSLTASADEETATQYNNLASILIQLGKSEDAEVLSRNSLAIFEKQFGADDLRVAQSLARIASINSARGNLETAEECARRALEIAELRLTRPHPSLARALNDLAAILVKQKRFDSAEALFRDALMQLQATVGDKDPETINGMINLSAVLYLNGKLDESELVSNQAILIARTVYDAPHPVLAQILEMKAARAHAQGDFAESESALREQLGMRSLLLGDHHPQSGHTMYNLANILVKREKYGDAADFYRKSLFINRNHSDPCSPDLAPLLLGYAITLEQLGCISEAVQLRLERLEIDRRILGDRDRQIATELSQLVQLLTTQNKHASAEPLARESLSIRLETQPPKHAAIAASQSALGAVLMELQQFDEAESLLMAAWDSAASNMDAAISQRKRAISQLITLYEVWNKPDMASHWRDRQAEWLATSQPTIEPVPP